jgi:hypothetical protein
MTPLERAARAKKASDAASAARKEKRKSMKRDQRQAHSKDLNPEFGGGRRYGECVLVAEFAGALDAWYERLHLKRNLDGSITLSRVGREVLANGREGRRLLPVNDDDAVITVSSGNIDEALSWLSYRGWDRKPGFGSAKRQIVAALKRKSAPPS